MRIARIFAVAVAWIALSAVASADVVIPTVTVGDPGNAPDTRYNTPGWGGVGYTYWIGTYEVACAEYVEFLNHVAADDTYELYNTEMWNNTKGCKIERLGDPGSYTYTIAPDRADRPVNYVSFWDGCRFANWLHNGQPTGPQVASTTERGSYKLDGYNGQYGAEITREANATWVIPSEDEWYKAAFYKGGGTDAGYWDYATQNDTLPSNQLIDPDPGNNANYYSNGYTIGAPYYMTLAGDFENSESAYDTFDMNGNVVEWNEAVSSGPPADLRCKRGGWFGATNPIELHASDHGFVSPNYGSMGNGFRVALVPEPATLGLLALGCGLLLKRRAGRPA